LAVGLPQLCHLRIDGITTLALQACISHAEDQFWQSLVEVLWNWQAPRLELVLGKVSELCTEDYNCLRGKDLLLSQELVLPLLQKACDGPAVVEAVAMSLQALG
ncbi:MAG: hypothetical protein J0651_03610, partial [Actinobacteria bacterium]|nr:hypothetical protein [Actinomycetota bacterium]